jgi:hypothetical protein
MAFSMAHDWVIDSGTNSHSTNTTETFSTFSLNSSTSAVVTAGGSKLPIKGKGCVSLTSDKTVDKVLYVPSMKRNLLTAARSDLQHQTLLHYGPHSSPSGISPGHS